MPLSLVGRDVDVAFYARQAAGRSASPGQAPVLVLGCGNGRLALELADRGHPVVGVDPSARMIAAAEERRLGQPPGQVELLRFLAADLRSLRLAERFGLVAAPHNALALMASLDELAALLATVRHHLSPDGAFVFDLINPAGRPPPPVAPGELPPRENARPLFAPHMRERRRTPRGASEEGIRRLRLRHFDAQELDAALREAGFVAYERFGRFDGKAFDPTDPQQIVVARLG